MKSELIPLMGEIRKWLAGGYGPLTLLIKPAEFETAVLGILSDEEVVERARILLGEERRVINQLALLPSEARLVNNLSLNRPLKTETRVRIPLMGPPPSLRPFADQGLDLGVHGWAAHHRPLGAPGPVLAETSPLLVVGAGKQLKTASAKPGVYASFFRWIPFVVPTLR